MRCFWDSVTVYPSSLLSWRMKNNLKTNKLTSIAAQICGLFLTEEKQG
jgi:hypothetical protein